MDNNELLRKCNKCKITKPKELFYKSLIYCNRCHIKDYIKNLYVSDMCVGVCVCVCVREQTHTYTYTLLLFVSLFLIILSVTSFASITLKKSFIRCKTF